MNNKKLPKEIIKEILLFIESREEIIRKIILEETSENKVYHYIEFDYENGVFYFKTDKIYNPFTKNFISVKNKNFNYKSDLLNYISACGYIIPNENIHSNKAYIYIPQDIMIKEYLK